VNLSADWNRDDYQGGTGLDRELARVFARLQREISRTVYGGFNVGFLRREFPGLDRIDDDLILGSNIGYRISVGLSLSLDYQHSKRDSSAVGADFTENRLFLRLAYIPVWSR
jgi:uncharacterized protein (PEP-CTERM system associated)